VRLVDQQEDLDKLDVKSNIKIVRIDLTDMKQRIRTSPGRCWAMIRDFVPKFQYEKLEHLHDILLVELEKVSRRATTIDDFVVIQSDLKALYESFDKLTEKFQEIEQYNIIIEEHKIKYPDKNKKKFKDVQAKLSNTRKEMEKGLENGEVEELRFKKDLIETEIPKINKDCATLT